MPDRRDPRYATSAATDARETGAADLRRGWGHDAPPRSLEPGSVDPSSFAPATRDTIADADPLVGRVLDGRIRINALLSRGGMGRVYAAEQALIGRRCAVKVMDARLLAGDDAQAFGERFFFEASTAAKLTHPNVVKIFDYGRTADGVCWLAMEYLDGHTLDAEIERSGPLSPERALGVARQVCRALREAHALGVVHRDVKPANVLLVRHDEDDRDFVKVLDFGLARSALGVTAGVNVEVTDGVTGGSLGALVNERIEGSPRFMAPEQSAGGEVDARADVYALGATLFMMLTGRPPFVRSTAVATLLAHASEPVPRLADVAPHVAFPEGVQELVDRCLAKDRSARFASMDELLVALKSFSGSDPLAATGLVQAFSSSRPAMGTLSQSMSYPLSHGSSAHASVRVTQASGAHHASSPPGASSHAPDAPPARRPRAHLPLAVAFAIVALGAFGIVAVRATRETPLAAAGTPADVAPATAARAPEERGAEPSRAAPPAPSTPPPAPRVTRITVTSSPPGARVREDDLEVCAATPCTVTFTAHPGASGASGGADVEHLLVVTKADYKVERKLVKESAKALHVTLSPSK